MKPVALVLAGALSFAAMSATACAFHGYKPEQTAIDRVIAADHLVIARPDPGNPFAYAPVETLRGTLPIVPITQLVDTTTRRRLMEAPGDGILFSYDPDTAVWTRIAYLDAPYRAVIDRVLALDWEAAYTPERLDFIGALLTHPDRDLRDVALRDVDTAPYAMLRQIRAELPVRDLLGDLWDRQAFPYQSIRVLLLGLSGSDAARAEIRAQIDRMAAGGWASNPGAFATALIELDGPAGVARLDPLVRNRDLLPDALLQVVEALAIQNGVADAEVRAAISDLLTRLVATHPAAAPMIARQFGDRQDWSQTKGLAQLLQHRDNVAASDLIPIAVYVAQGRATGETDE